MPHAILIYFVTIGARRHRLKFNACAARKHRVGLRDDRLEAYQRALCFDGKYRRNRNYQTLKRVAVRCKPPVQGAMHPGGDEAIFANASDCVAGFPVGQHAHIGKAAFALEVEISDRARHRDERPGKLAVLAHVVDQAIV